MLRAVIIQRRPRHTRVHSGRARGWGVANIVASLLEGNMKEIQLAELQKEVLAVIESVRLSAQPVLIVNNGKPLVKITPVSEGENSWIGSMSGTGQVIGDIISPVDSPEIWDVLAE